MPIKDSNSLDFLDLITLLGFWVGIENLESNMTQSDKQDLQEDLSQKAELLLNEIHGHLESQDKLLHQILDKLGR